MVTPSLCFSKYGEPSASNPFLTLWDVPASLEIGLIPRRIYCNKDLKGPLAQAFKNLIERCTPDGQHSYVDEIKTWDGCFNIRKSRGLKSMSLHSWAIAVDINAFENGLGQEPKLSPGFIACFTDAGFDWGGTWKRKDGMHFQLSSI